MHAGDSSLVCSHRSGMLVARTGVPLADAHQEFLGGRCRPNTVRAAAYGLKVFFSVLLSMRDWGATCRQDVLNLRGTDRASASTATT